MLAAISSKIDHFTSPQPEPYHYGHSANLAGVYGWYECLLQGNLIWKYMYLDKE
jgi:hypothetical protein